MTNNEKLIAARLLRMASDVFNNHGCNDFVLENTDENRLFAIAAMGEDDYDPHIPKETDIWFFDFVAMGYCADLLEKEVENDS